MYKVHHLINSRSQRVIWLLELLDMEYTIELHHRDPVTYLSPQSLKNVHPLGTSPILEKEKFTICESGAIAEFLIREAGDKQDLMPTIDSEHYIDAQFWAHYSEGSFIPPLVASLVLNKGRQKVKPFFIKFIIGKFIDAVSAAYFDKVTKRNLDFVEAHLTDKDYFLGDRLSIADVHMSYPIEALYKARKLNAYPNTKAYIEKIQQLPSYKMAMAKIEKLEQANTAQNI